MQASGFTRLARNSWPGSRGPISRGFYAPRGIESTSATLAIARAKTANKLTVRDGGRRIGNLNELEFIDGEIYANVWMQDRIARISPETGKVLSWIDLTGILPLADRRANVDVLNGIAYDEEKERLFVTGKLWPKLFEIELVPK